jgi:hypothetical protein
MQAGSTARTPESFRARQGVIERFPLTLLPLEGEPRILAGTQGLRQLRPYPRRQSRIKPNLE